MPKKLTEEQKQENFQKWQATDEYGKIIQFTGARTTIVPIEMGTKDITDKWGTFLQELYELMSALKVPGRKVKSK